jgi:hypothetical protein
MCRAQRSPIASSRCTRPPRACSRASRSVSGSRMLIGIVLPSIQLVSMYGPYGLFHAYPVDTHARYG